MNTVKGLAALASLPRVTAWLVGLCLLVAWSGALPAPQTFEAAKIELRRYVYFDQGRGGALGTIYCGCSWDWFGRSGGRVDFESCGFQVRAQEHRAIRTEVEHLVPSSWLGQQRRCWQEGGRANCQRTDPAFNIMEADMHNLTISVGEINADRSNFRFGVLPTTPLQHGACDFRVDFQRRVVEPRDEVKGLIARVHFYMADRYALRLSDQQQRLFMAWDQQFPVSAWEFERDRRIARRMGNSNPFVTGEKQWVLGYRGTGEGLPPQGTQSRPQSRPAVVAPARPQSTVEPTRQQAPQGLPIRGNRNSSIYHLPGCPSFDAMAKHNIIEFRTEAEAQAAGFRRAGNCK